MASEIIYVAIWFLWCHFVDSVHGLICILLSEMAASMPFKYTGVNRVHGRL